MVVMCIHPSEGNPAIVKLAVQKTANTAAVETHRDPLVKAD